MAIPLCGIIRRLVWESDGQDLVEYSLLLGVITLAAILAILTIGGKVTPYFTTLEGAMP